MTLTDRQRAALERLSVPAANGDAPSEAPTPTIRFVTARELRASTPEEVEWVWEGYIAAGTMVMLAGKPKYAGKSTLASSLVAALDAGAASFLGKRIADGPVVYVSEEADETFAPKLPDSDRISCLTRNRAWPRPTWDTLLAATAAEAQRIGARLVVIDAVSFWSALGDGQGNDSSVATAVLAQVTVITKTGAAVLLIHHQRKGGGEDGEAVLGATGFFASVDVLVELERMPDAPDSQRQLISIGRWPQTPSALVVDYDVTTASWRVVGEAAGRDEAKAFGISENLLRAAPEEPPGSTEPELAGVLGIDKRKISGPLRDLHEAGKLTRLGEGKKGDPYRYLRPPDDAAPNAAPGRGQHPLDDAAPALKGAASNNAAPPRVALGQNQAALQGLDADAELERVEAKFTDLQGAA